MLKQDSINIEGTVYTTGDSVECILVADINQTLIKDAKIFVDASSDKIYICHNNKKHNGACSPNKFGYYYSWVGMLRDKKLGQEARHFKKGYVKDLVLVKKDIFSNIVNSLQFSSK